MGVMRIIAEQHQVGGLTIYVSKKAKKKKKKIKIKQQTNNTVNALDKYLQYHDKIPYNDNLTCTRPCSRGVS